MGKVRRILEQRAYGAIAREQEAKQELEELRATGRGDKRSKLVAQLALASRGCRQAIELHDPLLEAYSSLCDTTVCQADREAIVGAVDSIFEKRHRASSAAVRATPKV